MIMEKAYFHFIDVKSTGKGPALFNFLHQPPTNKPATKTIRVHVCTATNPTAFPRKLKIAPTILPKIAGNASAAFPASLLSAFASLSNHFLKTPLSFSGEPLVPLSPLPKTPVMARTIVERVIERAVSIENIVLPCSWNKVRILSTNDVFLSRTFSIACLILATYFWRSFRFFDSISSLACFLYLSCLIHLCITVFVHRCKILYFFQLFGISFDAFINLS